MTEHPAPATWWHYAVWVPHFAAALASAAVAAACAWPLYRRSTRAAAGLCVHCGYDLRASPDRCPECGATAVAG